MVSAYFLVFTGFTAAAGKLGDLLGLRSVLVGGLLLFGLASLASGFAQNGAWLIAARALQGLGAAVIYPVSLAMVTSVFPKAQRGMAIGVCISVGTAFLAAGPLVADCLPLNNVGTALVAVRPLGQRSALHTSGQGRALSLQVLLSIRCVPPSPYHLNRHFGAVVAVDRVSCTDRDACHALGYTNTPKAAGEGLLANMGVVQNAGPQHRSVRSDHLPPVGIVAPAGVGMQHRDVKAVASVRRPNDLNGNHIGLPRPSVARRTN